MLTEPKDASYGDEAIESMAHCVQELFLQDEGSGESQARYCQYLHRHLYYPETNQNASFSC